MAAIPPGDQVERLLGSRHQLYSVTRAVVADGPGRGSEVLVVRNPAGISFDVLLDRSLDIGWADALGRPLAWASARGFVSAARYEPDGAGWVHTFGGGLLTTCGLRATGAASVVGGIAHPLHGRVGHIAAEGVSWAVIDDDGRTSIEITGQVVEAALGQPTLTLRRRIVAATSSPRIRIEDTVVNESWEVAGHMFRHHLNLGAPLVVPGSVVASDAEVLEERDTPGATSHGLPWVLDVPAQPEDEVVLHCAPGASGVVEVRAPSGAWVRVAQGGDFDRLVLWRDASPGVNVLGVEPSTSRDFGRAAAEDAGEVIWLEPGEQREYRTTITVGTHSEDLGAVALQGEEESA